MKKVLKLKESDLRNMVMESVRRYMLEEKENIFDMPNDMAEFFTPEQMNEPTNSDDEVDINGLFDFEGPDYDNMSDYMCESGVENNLPPQLGPWHGKKLKQGENEKRKKTESWVNGENRPPQIAPYTNLDEAVTRAMRRVLKSVR